MDTALDLVLEFKPTLRRQGLLMALLVAVFGVGAAISVNAVLHAFALPWRVLAMLALGAPAAWLAVVLFRQATSDKPVVRLDYMGISGAALREPVAWAALEDVVLHLGAGASRLQMLLKLDPTKTYKRRFLSVQDPTKPQISLHLLNAEQQQDVFYAIHARLGVLRTQSGAGVSASVRESRADEAFEDKLDMLTPRTWALYAMVAANVLVWAMNLAAGLDFQHPSSMQLYPWGANSASGVVVDGEWWRLLTAAFLHGGVMHIAFNMLGLWDAGKQLCRLLGNWQFTLIYLAAALCGSAASLHFTGQTTTSVGASGAVFGVLGALLTSSFKYRRHLPAYNRGRLWTGLGIFLVYSLARGFTEQGIDNAAHIGGLVGGAILGLLLRAPFDDATPASQRYSRAGLGMLATAGAVSVGVLATPVPTAWVRENYAGQAILLTVSNRFDSAFRRQAAEERRLQAGEVNAQQYLQNIDAGVAQPCRDIVAALAPLPVPLWEPTGHATSVRLRGCQNFLELFKLQVARVRRDPAQPPDAEVDAQLNRRLLDHAQMMREMGLAIRRPPITGPTSAPVSTR